MAVYETARPSGSRTRWRIAWLLFFVTVINYIDRQSFAVAAPIILKDLGLTSTQYGTITAAFLLAYGIGQVFGGRVIDLIGVRRSLAYAVAAWSAVCMLHAVGRGFYSFIGLRAALGFFESANYPAAAKAISEWFPARERSLAIGILLAGASFGAMVAPPLLSNAVEYLGWQEAFVFSGLIGVFWLWFWNRDYFSPERHPRISVLERDFIIRERAPEAPDSDRPAVLSLLRRRTVIGLLLARFFGDNILIFYTFWLPLYLSKERGLNLLEIGYFAWIPFLFTDLGSLAGGWIATRMMSAGVSLDATRKLMLLAAALLVPLSVLALQVESTLGAMLMIGVALFFNQFKAISISSLPSDLYPSRDVATIWGYLGAAGSLGAFLFSPAIGWAVDKVSFTPVFVAVAASPAVVLVIVLTFIPRIGSLPAGRSA